MINSLLPCIFLCAAGAVVKRILSSIGREAIASALQDIVGLLVLYMVCTNCIHFSVPSTPYVRSDATEYAVLQDDTMREVIHRAESEVAAQIANAVACKFSLHPVSCSVSIQQDTFALTDISITFSAKGKLRSGFEIQKYLEEEYGGNAEVRFYE